MFSYIIKKTFFDSAENLMKIIIFNLILLSALGGVLSLLLNMTNYYALPILGYIIFINFASTCFLAFLRKKELFKKIIINDLLVGIINSLISVASFNAIRYYSKGANILDNSLSYFIFWLLILWYIINMVIISIAVNDINYLNKVFKKSVLFAFENTKSIILIFPLFIILFLLTPFIIIGGGTALILLNNLYEVIKLKDDYLKENQDTEINWNYILKNGHERLEQNKVINLIFPWER